MENSASSHQKSTDVTDSRRFKRLLSKEITDLIQDRDDSYHKTPITSEEEKTAYFKRLDLEYQNSFKIASLLKTMYPLAFRFFVVDAETPFHFPKLWITREWETINLADKALEQVQSLGLKQDDLVIFLSGSEVSYQDKPCHNVVLFMYSDTSATAIPSPRDDPNLPSRMQEVFFDDLNLSWKSLSILYPGSSNYL